MYTTGILLRVHTDLVLRTRTAISVSSLDSWEEARDLTLQDPGHFASSLLDLAFVLYPVVRGARLRPTELLTRIASTLASAWGTPSEQCFARLPEVLVSNGRLGE
jgi:hypothetical protein